MGWAWATPAPCLPHEFIEGIVRELRSNPHLGLDPVGFLDDDLGKHEGEIHGVPVLGDSFDSAQDRHAIPEMAAGYKVSQVIIAMPTAPGAEIRYILRICGEAGVQARTIPGIYELLDGSVSVKQGATCGLRVRMREMRG